MLILRANAARLTNATVWRRLRCIGPMRYAMPAWHGWARVPLQLWCRELSAQGALGNGVPPQ